MRELAIVTVTYRSRDAAHRCLASLADDGLLGPGAPADVLVVDSGSGDGTAEALAAAYPFARVTALRENVGFARGCNTGIRASDSEFVLLLNPDTTVPRGAVAALVAYLRANPGVAAVGPRIVGDDGREARSFQSFPTPGRVVARRFARPAALVGLRDDAPSAMTEPGRVDWISGACMLIRRDAIAAIGLLDENYFLYYEETDWCLRAATAGWQIHHHPRVTVRHTGGASASESGEVVRGGAVARHFADSRRRYHRAHHGVIGSAIVEAAVRLRDALDRMRSGGSCA